MHSPTIRIALADDHQGVRQAYKEALEKHGDIEVVAEASTGTDFIERLLSAKVDVALLDVKMPGLNGIEVLKVMYSKYPAVKVLMLSAFFDEVYVGSCLEYGVNGYLTKNMEIPEIVHAIRAAYRNEVFLTNLLNDAQMKAYALRFNKSAGTLLPAFNPEELRILEMLREEKTTEEISSIMCMSKRSVELKRDRMREKANAKTIGGLLLYAMKRGLI